MRKIYAELDDELYGRAQWAAKGLGMTMSAFVRHCLNLGLRESQAFAVREGPEGRGHYAQRGGPVSDRNTYESAVMKCGCGDLRGIGEMHVTHRGDSIEPSIIEVMCVDCVLSKGWDMDLTATMLDWLRIRRPEKEGGGLSVSLRRYPKAAARDPLLSQGRRVSRRRPVLPRVRGRVRP